MVVGSLSSIHLRDFESVEGNSSREVLELGPVDPEVTFVVC